ncbi:MAG TPA: LuxR C-terminal-related transcriptional regulator [Thermomicrobiales bacterium]|nr:LuxR C-terminal-related transcriptional regulator [Thermomicrobiales bacterium]
MTALLEATTPLIGRTTALAELETLLTTPGTRLVTLTGTGGSGKTRLALQAARTVAGDFPGGVIVVSLAPIATAQLVAPTVARALGLREGGGEQLEQRIAAMLSDERTLVLLDNFEHVIDAAPFVSDLLKACPRLVVLTTSRMRLRVLGEREHLVPPLTVASLSDRQEPACCSEAALLFIDRMNALGAGGPANAAEQSAIEEICRRLDGLPLAVELSAAWSKVLRPPGLLAHLDPRLPMLAGGNRDAPARHRTVRATIQWSYDLLTPDEQSLFRWLAVFRGGFTLESAEVIAGDDGSSALHGRVLDVIAGLVDKSLLAPVAAFGGEPRFTTLETLREFAVDSLDAAGETPIFQERHARHFVQLARRLGPFLQWQPDTQGSIARLDEDQDNFRAALTWAEANDPHDAFLDLVSALEPYWALRGKLQEGRQWLERALPVSEDAPLLMRARTVRACAWNARYLDAYQQADELGQLAFELAQAAGDRYGVVHAQTLLGFSAHEQGNFGRASEIFEDVLARAQELGDLSWVAWATRNIGRVAHELQDFDTAQTMNERAIAIFGEAPCPYGAIEAQMGMALIAKQKGEFGTAAVCWRNRMGPGWDEPGLRIALEGLAEIAVALQRREWAARLLGAAEVQRERMGIQVRPAARARFDCMLESVRSALIPIALATAWDIGRQCSASEARSLAYAFVEELVHELESAPTAVSNQYGLTRRELEVLELVAAGRTNRQIADALFISLPTVKRHLTTTYGKLGVDSRGDAVTVLSETASG